MQSRIWAEVYGDQYPAGLDTYSYLTNDELDRAFHELALPAGGLLGDLACGRGGPGLWLANRSRARLIGVDVAQSALTAARLRARALGMAAVAEFRPGDFRGHRPGGGQSGRRRFLDALLFSPDKRAAVAEMARIIKPGGRVVMTTWDYHRQPTGRPPQVPDHRPLLEQAGFPWWLTTRRLGGGSIWTAPTSCCWRRLTSWRSSGMSSDRIRAGTARRPARTTSCMIRRVFAVAQLVPWPAPPGTVGCMAVPLDEAMAFVLRHNKGVLVTMRSDGPASAVEHPLPRPARTLRSGSRSPRAGQDQTICAGIHGPHSMCQPG